MEERRNEEQWRRRRRRIKEGEKMQAEDGKGKA